MATKKKTKKTAEPMPTLRDVMAELGNIKDELTAIREKVESGATPTEEPVTADAFAFPGPDDVINGYDAQDDIGPVNSADPGEARHRFNSGYTLAGNRAIYGKDALEIAHEQVQKFQGMSNAQAKTAGISRVAPEVVAAVVLTGRYSTGSFGAGATNWKPHEDIGFDEWVAREYGLLKGQPSGG